MAVQDLLKRISMGLLALGWRRLVALGLTGITVFLLVAVSSYFLTRPQREVVYSGLDQQDVTRIGAALDDAGISFDVNVSGDSVLVDYGKAAKARMLLAQKGLPRSESAGYELFDKLGSLGLTTFMQQVTKVRALEGELARTIQLIDGVRAARVHLAMRNDSSFRIDGDQATASVIIRADRDAGLHAANAIRHIVAAAIPGLAANQVTVMSADGSILTSTDDPASATGQTLMDLERSLAADTEQRIAKTLLPFLGSDNFRISVSAKINADKRQISETEFDPNSRVERSIRTIKESGEAQNANGAAGVSAEQNVPVEEAPKGSGDNSSERKDRKEELTNYEINSKSISTTSQGYLVDRLSVAIIVNKAQLKKVLGEQASDDAINLKLVELQALAVSAAGTLEKRGDTVQLTAIDFIEGELAPEAPTDEGFGTLLSAHFSSLLNAAAIITVTVLVLMLGVRPVLKATLGMPELASAGQAPALSDMSGGAGLPLGDMSAATGALDNFSFGQLAGESDPLIESLQREASSNPRDRLSKIVDLDPDRAVEVMKVWLSDSESGKA
jgi:flagellar M-ring protein FliF